MNLSKGQRRLRAQARGVRTTIIRLSGEKNDYAVYSDNIWLSGPFKTPLLFRGTLEECIEWRKA